MSDYDKKLEANIWKYYLATVFKSASNLWRVLLFLFYASIGLSLPQFGILASITAASMLVFNIPSGILADKVGRRNILIISSIFGIITCALLLYSDSFFMVALAAFVFGLEVSFRSGTNTALMYETYKYLKKESSFKSFRAKNFACEMVIISIFSVLAGYIAEISFTIVFLISLIFMFLYAIIVYSLREPPKHYVENSDNISVQLHLSKSFKEVISDRKVFIIFLYALLIGGIVEGFYKFNQIYATNVGFSLHAVGIGAGIIFLIAGITSYFGHKIEKVVGYTWSIFAIPLGLGTVYLLMGISYTYYAAFLLLLEAALYGYYQPLITDLQNKFISSHMRATILSISSFSLDIIILLISLIIGFLSVILGFNTIYVILGLILIIVGVVISQKLINIVHQ